ncbi:MAG: transglutaminase-like domain-containing protein [Gammaproteobacteria bacterium]
MSALRALLPAVALCVAAVLCALAMTPFAALLALPPVTAMFVRGRLPLRGLSELIVSALAAGMGFMLPAVLGVSADHFQGLLGPVASQLAFASLLVVAVRSFIAVPRGGLRGTLAFGLTAVLGAGCAQLGFLYPLLAAAYLLLGLLALRADDPARPPLARLGRRQVVAAAGFLAVGAAAATGLALALPPLYERASVIALALEPPELPTIGFSEGPMFLGSMDGMLSSDQVVLRIFGAADGVHLRGAVFTRYEKGRWLADADAPQVEPAGALPAPGVVEVEMVQVSRAPLFLPLDAGRVTLRGGQVRADAFGILRPLGDQPPDRFWYAPGGRDRYAVAPPGPADLDVPDDVRGPIRALAAEWTAGAGTAEAKVAALVSHLERDYIYSQHFTRTAGRDPVLDFLLSGRRGHCQYFASALTLLARSADVPARMVTGYRVSERSPLLPYHIVRQRSAHAWSEVALPGGWTTLDPAPLESLEEAAPERTPLFAALFDLMRLWARSAWEWFLPRDPMEAAVVVLGALLVTAAWAWLLRRRTRIAAPGPGLDLSRVEPPMPCLTQLLSALESRGVARRRGESLERLAGRLVNVSLPPPIAGEAAELLRHYAALRYGGLGDEVSLTRDMAALTVQLDERLPVSRP